MTKEWNAAQLLNKMELICAKDTENYFNGYSTPDSKQYWELDEEYHDWINNAYEYIKSVHIREMIQGA